MVGLPGGDMRLLTVPLVVAALAGTAAAAPYEVFIDVESLEDLDDLLATEQISSDTHGALYELMSRGVDLDRATREELYSLPNLTYDEVDAILAYRDENRFIANPTDLVAAGAITEQKLLAISAFLIQVDRRRGEFAPRGTVLARVRATQGDHDVPPMSVRARAAFGKNLSAGLAMTVSRLRLGEVSWDPNRDAFLAEESGVQPHVPKAYVRWRGDRFDVVAGSYRMGFGERLTFDNSTDYTPNGIYVDNLLRYAPGLSRECKQSTGELAGSPCSGDYDYVTPDEGWSEGLLGVAAGTDHLTLGGDAYLQAYAWGSYNPRGLYQYQLAALTSACTDPRNDAEAACGAPAVFIRPDGDPLSPAAAAAYQTLPNLYAEALVGAHVAVHARRRAWVGVTGYGASTQWLVDVPDGITLSTQEWSPIPIGGRYGAVGVSAGYGHGVFDVFAEVTRSFDRMGDWVGELDGGGGLGAIVRVTRSLRKRELEVSARYYDPDFVNPYAGPIAAADQVDGQRARGELGARVRYAGVHGNLNLRVVADLWRAYILDPDGAPPFVPGAPANGPTDGWVPRLDAYVHADLTASDQIAYGLWLDFADKDLGTGGLGQCYATFTDTGGESGDLPDPGDVEDETGVAACKGMQLRTTGRLRYKLDRATTVTAQLAHTWVDDTHYDDKRRQDLAASVTAAYRKNADLRLRGRVKYLSRGLADRDYLEESIWTYGEVALRTRGKDVLTVRGDLFYWLDERERTALRSPRAEVRMLGTYQYRF